MEACLKSLWPPIQKYMFKNIMYLYIFGGVSVFWPVPKSNPRKIDGLCFSPLSIYSLSRGFPVVVLYMQLGCGRM